MTKTRSLTCFVVAPGGLENLALALAAGRSGATGIVDLEYAADLKSAANSIRQAVGTETARWGVKLAAPAFSHWKNLFDELPNTLNTVILASISPSTLREQVRFLRSKKLQVFVEAVTLDEALAAEKAGVDGVDGVIAKGNEAGGRVSEETTFVLLQQFIAEARIPILAQGGVGPHSAAACYAAGARGVVLDWQVALFAESRLPDDLKSRIARMDGSETQCAGRSIGALYRLYVPRGSTVFGDLEKAEQKLLSKGKLGRQAQWAQLVADKTAADGAQKLWLIGQDVALAASLAKKFTTLQPLIKTIQRNAVDYCLKARALKPLAEGAGSARVLGTRFPIVQGPMSRVSDTPAFAKAVAEAGALPIMAVAMTADNELEQMLKNTARELGQRPWAVGVMGFLPPDFYAKQLKTVKTYKPPFALIAGGRPAQAAELEAEGIRTYVHTPAAGLLRLFLDAGVKRYVFEGRECGGHTGRFTSFVLWETAIDALLEKVTTETAREFDLWFAGGISNAMSAAMLAAMTAPLVERGMHIGVLMGTAYLLTREAVSTGAIGKSYQERLLKSGHTDVLDSGNGYEVRTAPGPFTETFEKEKSRMQKEGKTPEEVRNALELLNLGRLRIAAKGIAFNVKYLKDPSVPMLLKVPPAKQVQDGIFMAGQVIALYGKTNTIEKLHHTISTEGTAWLDAIRIPQADTGRTFTRRPCDIAIVGMSCVFPKAPDLNTFWENMLNKVNAIGEVPPERWDWRRYYDPDQKARDKVYSKWGGFIDPIVFDPLKYNIVPKAMNAIDPMQLLSLEIVSRALKDAGYADRSFDRRHASVIMGVAGGLGELGVMYTMRTGLPLVFDNIPETALTQLPEWTEDSFPGLLGNVVAGRIANAFDFGGTNCAVDAACASSLAAVYLGVKELTDGSSNLVVVGGVDASQNPFGYMCFAKTFALSPSGQSRPFDAKADGIVIGEGVAAVVMKRVEDAERDGDRIYAVIRGMSSSSDGRGKSMTAPSTGGQVLAIRRACAQAGYPFGSVQFIEAHGTGTNLGDRTEAQTLAEEFKLAGAQSKNCAVGSIKSMIGHTKGCAGIASLIKTALSLYHKVIPPTLGVTNPAPENCWGPDSSIYVNTDAMPWIESGTPRRAGVNAFGFGGTNFHAELEEYRGEGADRQSVPVQNWPCELFCWSGESAGSLAGALEKLNAALNPETNPALRDLAFTINRRPKTGSLRLAIVAESIPDLKTKLAAAIPLLRQNTPSIRDPKGIYFSAAPLAREGRVAFVFPGQASQRPNMLRELAILFAEVRDTFALADRVVGPRLPKQLSRYIYPPPSFSGCDPELPMKELTATQVTQPALGAVEMGLYKLLHLLGIRPDMLAGHSVGEYAALCAAGVIAEDQLYDLLTERGQAIVNSCTGDTGTMLAVKAGLGDIENIIKKVPGVYAANLNSPSQTVLAGLRPDLDRAAELLATHKIKSIPIAVSCGFHSPLMKPAQASFNKKLAGIPFGRPHTTIYSNLLAAPYPSEARKVRTILGDHLVSSVRFAEEIEKMYEDGARLFVEVGPGNVSCGLIRQILDGKKFTAVYCDTKSSRHDLFPILNAVAELAAEGVEMNLGPLFERRSARELDLDRLSAAATDLKPTHWYVSPDRAWPVTQPKPVRVPVALGTGAAISPVSLAAEGGTTSEVVLKYERLMATFLQQQREVMLSYLQNRAPEATRPTPPSEVRRPVAAAPTQIVVDDAKRAAAPAPITDLQNTLLSIVADRTGYPAEMLKPEQSMEADLGIDSIKRVEVLAAFAKAVPGAPGNLAEKLGTASTLGDILNIASASSVGQRSVAADVAPSKSTNLQETLLSIVAERTGYPVEMLKLEQSMEADLGIDSIKRVEVLAAFAKAVPGAPGNLAEKLGTASTLGEILNLASASSEEPRPVAADAAPSKTINLQETLLAIVADRTGYPVEMLKLEQSMEADLGIDSIKRVEVLAAFAKAVPGAPGNLAEKLGTASTLGDILNLASASSGKQRSVAAEPAQVVVNKAVPSTVTNARFLLKAVDVPADKAMPVLARDSVLVITRDEFGVAEALADEIKKLGAQPVMVDSDKDVESVRKKHGTIAGLINLIPLRKESSFEKMNFKAWRETLDRDVKGLYRLIQAAGGDICKSARGNAGWLITAAALNEKGETHIGQAGFAGLIKSTAEEWVGVRCRVLHLSISEKPVDLARHILSDMAATDKYVEIFHCGKDRFTLLPVRTPLNQNSEGVRIGSDWVILVTGGAVGITAEVVLELAQKYKPTFALVGRSAYPEQPEAPETAHLDSPKDIKAALADLLRAQGGDLTPTKLESAFSRLMKDREIRQNVEVMKRAGAKVQYFAADVRDEKSFGGVIDQIYKQFGRLDGVIHGAGIIEDKLILDKTPESFDRVFGTKTESAFILFRRLRADSLKFIALFTSVAGCFGNRGQSDYAAANEVVTQLARRMDTKLSCRIVAFDWGPWEKKGMVTPEIKRQFEARGIELVQPADGRRYVDEELRFGQKGEVRVIYGDGPWGRLSVPAAAHRWPLLIDAAFSHGDDGVYKVVKQLDPARDLYLQDHRLDGHPVLPAAVAVELMSEAVQAGHPDWRLASLKNVRVLKGIVLADGAREIGIAVESKPADSQDAMEAEVVIHDPTNRRQLFYRATAVLNRSAPTPTPFTPPLNGLKPFSKTAAEAYRDFLFHGERFQSIQTIEGVSEKGMTATLRASRPGACVAGASDGRWLIDPILLDSGPQMAILWARQIHNVTPLPSGFGEIRVFESPRDASTVRCFMEILNGSGKNNVQANVYFVDADDRMLISVTGMEATGSESLNRLAGKVG